MRNRALSVILTIALAAGTLGGAFSGAPAALASPTTEMYLSPTSGIYSTAGADFSVTVMLNTGGETVNAVRAYLTFDSTRLSVTSITAVGSAFPGEWPTTFDNDAGTIDINRVTGGNTTFNGTGSIATIAFHPKADGAASVQIVLAQSVVCRAVIPPPNVLSIAGSGSYTIVSPGVTLSTSTVTVTEGGAGSSYTVVLDAPPAASVSVAVTPDTQVTRSPGTLTFTTGNWSTPQTVTVNAVDDAVAEGAHTGTISHAVTSTDSAYNGLSVGSVTANITDNDYTLTYTAGTGGSITAPATSPTTHTSGAIVTITAAANAGYHFVNWTGDVATVANVNAASTTITMNANYAIQANFAGYDTTITVASGGNGTVTPVSSFTQTYGASGTAITASPATGYHFVSWSATVNPSYVTIASPTSASTSVTTTSTAPDGSTATVTATFAINTFTLTYSAGTNGHIDGTTPQTVNYGGSGSQVTATPDTGYHFVQWSDASTANPRQDTNVTASISVTATFAPNDATITVASGGNGTVTPVSSFTQTYGASGTAITATPALGYHFVSWSATSNPTYVTIASPTSASTSVTTTSTAPDGGTATVTATFAPNDVTITVASGGNGTVTPVSSFTQTYGASGTAITATPAAGYHFVSWSATVNPSYVTIASPTSASTSVTTTSTAPDGGTATVTATFAINTFTLTYSAGTNGHIDGTTPQTVNYGGSGSQVTATPDTGYHFVQWSDASTANPRQDTNVTASISVTATFAPNDATITVASGGNGTVTPVSSFTQTYGASGTAITATPAPGYHFVSWSATSNPTYVTIASPTSASTSVTTTSSAPDGSTATVTATFAPNDVTITVASGGNGTVTPVSSFTQTYGASGTAITASPATGYHFVSWSATSNPSYVTIASPTSASTSVTTTSTAPDGGTATVTATFAPNDVTITVASGGNGTVTPVSSFTQTYGASGTAITASPAAGYHFVSWSATSNPSYVTIASPTSASTSVTTTSTAPDGSTATVTATFAPNDVTITVASGGNGTVTPVSSFTQTYGATGTAITASPATGYHFVSWSATVNPSYVTIASPTSASTSVTTTSTAPDGSTATVTATFAINTFTLTYSAGTNGHIDGTTPQTVNYGGSGSQVTATADVGYFFVKWSDNVMTASRTDTNVTADISVTATFAINIYTIVASAGSGGSITPSGNVTVGHGSSQAFTISPAAGYHIQDVLVDTLSVGTPTSHTFTNVTGNHTITATFAGNETGITVTSGGNGTVTPTATFTQVYGASGTAITATPAPGYHFVSWSATVNPSYVTIASPTSASTSVITTSSAPDYGAATVTATFAGNDTTVTVAAGANGSITSTTPFTQTYGASGTTITASPAPGYHFVSWSATSNPTYVTIASPTSASTSVITTSSASDGSTATITATFAGNETGITVTSGGNGTVTPTATFTQVYGASGTAITATPAPGYHFVSWSATVNPSYVTIASPTSASTSVITTSSAPDYGAATVTATFAGNDTTVTVAAGANGSITSTTPFTQTYGASGTTITASPAPGYHFVSWSATSNPTYVTIASPTSASTSVITTSSASDGSTATITATFAGNETGITVTSGGNGTVTPTATFTQVYGASGTAITATPAPGYHFVSWSATVNPSYVTIASPTSASTSVITTSSAPDYGAATVTATFAINTYTLSTGQIGNGSVSKNPSQVSYDHGTVVQLTATPDPGWHFTGWSGDLGGSTNPGTITMDANKTITASFAPNDVTVTVASGGNGTVTPVSSFTQTYGATGTAITASPAAGYHFVSWSATSNPTYVTIASPTSASTSVTTTSTAPDGGTATVTATFAINTYTLTYTAGTGGLITAPATSPTTHASGAIVTITAAANAGYHFVNWTGDVATVANVNAASTTITMNASYAIQASFAPNDVTITVASGGNGTVTPVSPFTQTYGASGTAITASPATGYHFVSWSATSNPTYVTIASPTSASTSVTTNSTAPDGSTATVTATFAPNDVTITVASGGNGTVTPVSSFTQAYGASGTAITASPATGYHFVSWSATSNPTYVTIASPTSASTSVTTTSSAPDGGTATVTATFAINTYTIVASATAGGSITPSGNVSVNHGSSQSFAIAPSIGYHIQDVLVDGLSVGTPSSHTFTNVTAGHTIAVSFAINSVTITVASGGNGTVTPVSSFTQTYGASGTAITATPASGYHFVSWFATSNPTYVTIASSTSASTSVTTTSAAPDGGTATVTATFAINTYTLTVNVTGSGTVTKNPNQATYNHGASVQLTATAAMGWYFAGWSGSISGITNPETLVMDGNKTITASFVQRAVIVSPTSVTVSEGDAGAGYLVWLSEQPSASVTVSVTCTSAATVSTASLTFTTVNWSVPQVVTVLAVDDSVVEGTHYATVSHASSSADTSYNGLSISSVAVTILDNDHYSVSASVTGGHGSVSPSSIDCDPGNTASFTLIPDAGYHVASIVDNGVIMPIANPYVISSVQASHTIVITYHINVYTITVQVWGLGTVAPSGTVNVEHGASQNFRIEPAPGWILAEVQVDGVRVPASSIVAGVYTMTGITASHRLTVLFGTFGDLIAPLLTTYGPDAHVAQGTPGTVPAAPMFQHTMNKSEFDLRIAAQDAGGPVRVVVLNDGMLIREGLIEGEQTLRLALPDGSHDVVVKAFDIAGNMSAVLFRVVVDTAGPVITTGSLPTTVSTSTVTVKGSAEDWVTGVAGVRVGGVDVSAVGGTFERKVKLVAGINAIVVEATDGAGNTSTARLTVAYKPIPVVTSMAIQLTIGRYWMYVDGTAVKLDSAPVIRYSRTMVPIRAVVEAIGGTISWDAAARKVTIVHGGTTIELWIGKNTARVNGRTVKIDPNDVRVLPFIVNGRTMLPLRFVAETLGLDVEWDAILRRVTLTYWH